MRADDRSRSPIAVAAAAVTGSIADAREVFGVGANFTEPLEPTFSMALEK